MKKIIIAAAMILSLSAGAYAQQQETTVCPETTEAPAAQTSPAVVAARHDAFQGLELTDSQRQSLQAIEAQCRESNRQARRQQRSEAQQNREECRRNYLAQIKQILTPEQYLTFLENSYVNGNGGPTARMHNRRSTPAKMQHRRTQHHTMQQAQPTAQPADNR